MGEWGKLQQEQINKEVKNPKKEKSEKRYMGKVADIKKMTSKEYEAYIGGKF